MDSSHFQNIQEAYNSIYSQEESELLMETPKNDFGGRIGRGIWNTLKDVGPVLMGDKNAQRRDAIRGDKLKTLVKTGKIDDSIGTHRNFGSGYRGAELQAARRAAASQVGTAGGRRWASPDRFKLQKDRLKNIGNPPPDRSGSKPPGQPTSPTGASGGSQRPAQAARPAPAQAARPAPARVAQTGNKGNDTQTRPKTFNPLMQKTFGYQTGNAPDQRAKAAPSPTQMAARASVRTGTTGSPVKPITTAAKPVSVNRARGSSKPGSLVSDYNPYDDVFDIIRDYLLDEGYAETEESAIAIMSCMSDEWIDGIIQESVKGSERSLSNIITGHDIRSVGRGGSVKYKKPKWKDDIENKVRGGVQLRKRGEAEYRNDLRDRERQKENSKSIKRLNAKPGEDNGEYDAGYYGDDDTSNGNHHYSLSRTNQAARKRRASGR